MEARDNHNIDVLLDIMEKELRNLPRAFLWQAPFLDFIAKEGSRKQVDRYIALENEMVEAMDNESLKKAVNKALKELKEDGTLSKISIKYFGEDLTKE